MSRVAVVADSASDLPPNQAKAAGITVVPLLVSFGDREYRAGVDLSGDDFWRELTAPGAPFPKTAAAAPGTFKDTFEGLFADGVDEIVYVGVGSKLSATLGSAKVAREMLPDRKIHIVDSNTASMGTGLLVLLAAEKAASGMSAEQVVAEVNGRLDKVNLYVVLETLEYLKRGGRISPARAAIGSVLSIKPIITLEDGAVETADRPRTRGRARERLLELLVAAKPERVAVLHGQSPDIEAFASELAAATGVARDKMTINLIGASVGPHVGPGAYGAVTMSA
ncbi:MAG: DegV family protein [Candidatus Limnocylindrales bacterium]